MDCNCPPCDCEAVCDKKPIPKEVECPCWCEQEPYREPCAVLERDEATERPPFELMRILKNHPSDPIAYNNIRPDPDVFLDSWIAVAAFIKSRNLPEKIPCGVCHKIYERRGNLYRHLVRCHTKGCSVTLVDVFQNVPCDLIPKSEQVIKISK